MLSKIIDAVREAGKLILNADDIEVASKDGGANYVTKYDFMVQEFLCKRLKEIVPDAGFVGEEGSGGHEKAGDGYCFIIDPIDGTTNFICNYKLIAVSVGAYSGLFGQYFREYPDNKTGYIRTPCHVL